LLLARCDGWGSAVNDLVRDLTEAVAEAGLVALDSLENLISSRYRRDAQFIEMLVAHQPDFEGA
jgi:hypothetical protein